MGHAKKKPIDLSKLRTPGFSQRPHRVKRALAVCTDFIRQQEPSLDKAKVEAKAAKLLADLDQTHPWALREFELTAPSSTCPDRAGINSKVEIAAMRSLPQAQELERVLANGAGGRPSKRALAIAIFECNAWMKGGPEIRCHYEDFMGSDHLLDWAYGYPADPTIPQGRSESAVNSTFNAMLERHDPKICIRLNVELMRKLAEDDGDIGRYLAVDGTDFTAPVDQAPALSPSEEALIRRNMSVPIHSHGPDKNWRGWVLVQLIDIKSTLPAVWVILPLELGREFQAVPLLLDLLFEHWPDCPAEYLVGDKEFDVSELCAELEFRYGIHPVWPQKGKVAPSHKWAATGGTPSCSRHGLMKLEWAERFVEPKGRLKRGIPEDDLEELDQRARLRWRCPASGCGITAATHPSHNPRLYTYLPRKGEHRRAGRRVALLKRRNQVESVIASLKGRGIGLRGQMQPNWVSSDRQAEWLAGAALLGLTLRRTSHEWGAYVAAEAEARALGLVKR
jgi:hypothetical protein